LLDVAALERASRRQRSDAAVGVDGVPKEAYGQHLQGNLQDLHRRLKTKPDRHQPLRRVPLPKAQGKTRPIGRVACEDQLLPDAVREVREALYEQDFLASSPGFRPKRGAQGAVRPLKRIVDRCEVKWRYAADMGAFVDSVDRPKRKELLGMRGADGSPRRLIGKCWHVGGLDGAAVLEPALGTAQGAGLSPL
jgi:retron-type reverse transcriptase